MDHERKSLKEQLREAVLADIDFSRENSEEELWEKIDEQIVLKAREQSITVEERMKLRRELFSSLRQLDVLQELVDDPSVTEIMVNGVHNIFVEQKGRIRQWDSHFDAEQTLQDVIQQIVARCNRVVNEASPIVDARLENGSRVNIVLNPIALNGPILTIRRFPDQPVSIKQLISFGSLTEEVSDFLCKLVKSRYNILVSGGTGSGKTTFLNVLSNFVPTEERIITIEDSAELQIRNVPNLVSLETRNANAEGCREITIRELIRTSLRMRPDRVIVGEVRGGEAIDMLQAMNTGHDGSMSTGHANSAQDMLNRLETMVLMGMELPLAAIRKQIASGIDIIVHLGRLRDKTRKVLQIMEIVGLEQGEIQLSPLYLFEEEGEEEGRIVGTLQRKKELIHREKLESAGIRLG